MTEQMQLPPHILEQVVAALEARRGKVEGPAGQYLHDQKAVPRPYVFSEYPKCLYHPDLGHDPATGHAVAVIARDSDHEDKIRAGHVHTGATLASEHWRENPEDFHKEPVKRLPPGEGDALAKQEMTELKAKNADMEAKNAEMQKALQDLQAKLAAAQKKNNN